MPIYTRYAARTGEILDHVNLPDRQDIFDRHNALLHTGELDGETHYLPNGIPTERPAHAVTADKTTILANGEDIATISGIADPAIVEIAGPASFSPFELTGGVLEFSACIPGDYEIRIEAFPVLPAKVTIHAV